MIPDACRGPGTDGARPGHTGFQPTVLRSPLIDKDPPEDDDAALFRSAIGRLRELPQVAPPPARPKPRPGTRMAELDDAEALGEFQRLLDTAPLESGDALRHRRDDVPPHVLKRLAQGRYSAQDELDLHHAGAVEAEALLRRFVQDARAADARCVRIIHGKGLNSAGIPVLKNLVDRLLRQRGDVLAFHSAPAAQGGTGAVLVLLKPR